MQVNICTTENLYGKFIQNKKKVCTDSRKIIPDSIFFALSGENFDGNKFAKDALEKGCAYAVVSNPEVVIDERYLLVNDVLVSLQDLARHHRKQFSIPVIGITGSNGKTTSKELIHAVLSKKFNTLATIGNLNNHIGVPLTLLRLDESYEMAVIEMGANHVGEIKTLSEIALPDYGVITNVGKAHLEGFGGFEGVKKGKAELYDFLKFNKGIAFLHADDVDLMGMASGLEKKVTYGTNKLYDVVGKLVDSENFISFKWKTRYTASQLVGAPVINTHLVGKYNYFNLLCAACIGNFFRVEEDLINEAITSYLPTNNRSQFITTPKNRLILDMYNANPTSMQAALENFIQLNAIEKVVILGDMLELGEETEAEHIKVVQLVNEKSIVCFFVGKNFYALKDKFTGSFFIDVKSALNYFSGHQQNNKTILIKGSRGVKLEELLPALS